MVGRNKFSSAVYLTFINKLYQYLHARVFLANVVRSVSLLNWSPCPNVAQASTKHDLRLGPGELHTAIFLVL